MTVMERYYWLKAHGRCVNCTCKLPPGDKRARCDEHRRQQGRRQKSHAHA